MTDSSFPDQLGDNDRQALLDLLLAEEGLDEVVAENSIPVRSGDEHELPLSYSQKRLWFLDRVDPKTSAFNIPASVLLKGKMDFDVLQNTLNAIVARHESLRTNFGDSAGVPFQIVKPTGELTLELFDLRHIQNDQERQADVDRILLDISKSRFDIAQDVLVRVGVLRLSDEEQILSLVMHHIISDGWSLNLFMRELAAVYISQLTGGKPELPELKVQYPDYAIWQQEWIDQPDQSAQLDYWLNQLGGTLPVTELPADFRRPIVATFDGGSIKRDLGPVLSSRVRSMSQRSGSTPFMVLLALLKALIYRQTGQDDLLIGTPIAGRTRPELEDLIGFFLNTLVLRTQIAEGMSFTELVQAVRQVSQDAFANQDIPFELLLNELKPERDRSRTPFFQIFFNMLNFDNQPVKLPGLEGELIANREQGSKFDITIYVSDSDGELRLHAVYNANLYRPERMEELLEQYIFLLEQVLSEPDKSLLEHSLLTDQAKKYLPDPHELLDASWHGSVPSALQRQAAANPNLPAVEDENEVWSYGELNSYSNRLAQYLVTQGVGENDLVAIYGHRSASLVWAVMGILGSGAGFLVLDPSYPPNRLRDYIDLAEPKAWLQLEAAGQPPAEVVDCLESMPLRGRMIIPTKEVAVQNGLLSEYSAEPPAVNIGPNQLAYVSFTSGSTGRPKGVLGRHGSLTHFIPWQSREYNLTEADRFTMLSGLAHDPLQRDMFTALWVGGCIVVPNPDKIGKPGWLGNWLREKSLTIAHLTPAMGQLIAESALRGEDKISSLRYAFFVGDVLTRRDVGRLCAMAPNLEVINFYGSQETQRAVSYFPVPPVAAEEMLPASERVQSGPIPKEIIPLGIGMPDVQLVVVNKHGQPAGVGESGEVYVRSPHLALGYLGNPELTASRFIQNPFSNLSDDPMYRTGDLGRYGVDSVVEFMGRGDHQVKVRGYRIELGEIEASLGYHENVREAVVLLRPTGDERSEKQLVAYVVPQSQPAPEVGEMRRFLQARLPDYMVPPNFLIIDELPLTPNRKVDRRALLAMKVTSGGRSKEIVAARDDLERELVKLWENVLRVSPIGIHDDFFALGGHSLLGMRLFAQMEEELGHSLPVSSLFQAPTISQLAELLRISEGQGDKSTFWSSLVPIQPNGSNTPFFYVSPFLISVLSLANLSKHLGKDQPLYGIQPQGLDGVGEVHGRIEDMASHYLSEIRSLQPHGPYVLGGHCSGNWVAYEMAQQLKADGEEVAMLLMVDSGPPNIQPPKVPRWKRIINRLAFYFRDGRLWHAVAWRSRILFGRFVLYRLGTSKSRQVEEVREAHREAYQMYKTDVYDGDIYLIRSEESTQLRDKDWHLRWSEMATGEFEYDIVSGTHANLLEEPHVYELADRMKKFFAFAKRGVRLATDREEQA